MPALEATAAFALHAEGKEMSTTMAFVRLLGNLLKDQALGPRVVPIVADEARTFGMASLFRTGRHLRAVRPALPARGLGLDALLPRGHDGQILEEGITEAGALSSWTAAATSYSTHGLPMLPFYIYYSMFGFQRVGDLIWAAADQRARGFLIGATAGRTTLGGEGLQHQDGTSHLVAATVPNCRAYDPATAGELAVIVDRGMREMLSEQQDVFYYVTAMNENVAQPSLPAEAHEGVLRGLYRFRAATVRERAPRAAARPSGAILGEAVKAATQLEAEHGVAADVWSVTSFSELARDGIAAETGVAARRGRACRAATSASSSAPTRRADRHRHRLRARRARADPRLPAAGPALRHARHRRLRPQRHARGAAAALRGRRGGDRAGGACARSAERTLDRHPRASAASPCAPSTTERAAMMDSPRTFSKEAMDPTALTISEAAAAIRSGETTAWRMPRPCSPRPAGGIAQRLHPSRSRAGAGGGPRRRRGGRAAPLGPLHGVPLALKDNLDTADMPTTGGTPGLRGHRPKRNAQVVQKLLDAGAIVFGKTNLHELAYGITNNNAGFGPARNPYDPTRIPGGSSGGVGVAVGAPHRPRRHRLRHRRLGARAGGAVRHRRLPADHRALVAGRHRADLAHPRHAGPDDAQRRRLRPARQRGHRQHAAAATSSRD